MPFLFADKTFLHEGSQVACSTLDVKIFKAVFAPFLIVSVCFPSENGGRVVRLLS